jgi:hypothetical protein
MISTLQTVKTRIMILIQLMQPTSQFNNFFYFITLYIDFIFPFYFYFYIKYYFSFLQILGFMFFITLLRNCYFLIGIWNNLCKAWRLFGLKQILMMSWEARSRITNLSQLSPNNNTSNTPKMSVKESFWVLTTNAWGSYFSLIFRWNCDCVFLDLPRCCELAVFGRVLVIVFISLQLLGKNFFFFLLQFAVQ